MTDFLFKIKFWLFLVTIYFVQFKFLVLVRTNFDEFSVILKFNLFLVKIVFDRFTNKNRN